MMTEETRKFVEEKTKEILNAGSCCTELKAYLQELSEDVQPIEALISFASSEKGAEVFGAEQAKSMVEAGKVSKANGGKYCICPACSAGGAILDKKSEIL